MSQELKLLREIEQRECLYNYQSPDYSRKEATEEAWREVANITQLTVNNCKEKWRNIRWSLIRSMKASSKKPYHLKDHLQFVLPFIKPWSRAKTVDMGSLVDSGRLPTVEDAMKQGMTGDSREAMQESFQSMRPMKAKKRLRAQMTVTRRSDSRSQRYFLMSLLPDLETMSHEQLRYFKIQTMVLIDNIKSKEGESSSVVSAALEASSGSESADSYTSNCPTQFCTTDLPTEFTYEEYSRDSHTEGSIR